MPVSYFATLVILAVFSLVEVTDCIPDDTGVQGPCPDASWIRFNESCYYFSQDRKTNYYDALSWCRARGAQLVSIGSEEENKFVADLQGVSQKTGTNSWIGLYKRTCIVLDNGYWLDGTISNYSNMKYHEPNENVCCYRMDEIGQWKDINCFLEYQFVCEMPILNVERKNFKRATLAVKDGYIKSHTLSIIESKRCSALVCFVHCLQNHMCNGFNIRRIPSSHQGCTCELKGSESWMSLERIKETGSEHWSDPTITDFVSSL